MYVKYNPNPQGNRVGDCVIRALTKAFESDWEKIYTDLCVYGLEMCDMPSANVVWGTYLRDNGFTRNMIPDSLIDRYTVENFCHDYPKGTFVLALSSHVICVKDGDYFDSWDSGGEIPLYFWERSENI